MQTDADQDGGWQIHHLFLNSSVTLPDGTSSGRLVMRRMVEGRWEYRAPTKEEEAEYVSSEAW